MIIVMPPHNSGRKKAEVLPALIILDAAQRQLSSCPGSRYDAEYDARWGRAAKISFGFLIGLLVCLVLLMITLIVDSMTSVEVRSVKAVQLISVEIDKGGPKHHPFDDWIFYRVSWPGDPTRSWKDESHSDISCLPAASARIGTVKNVWYHEQTSRIFGSVTRWTAGGQTFCQ